MMERDLEMEVETRGVPELRSFSVSYKMKYTILYVNIFTQADHQHAYEKVH